jgi:hypothetical protein
MIHLQLADLQTFQNVTFVLYLEFINLDEIRLPLRPHCLGQFFPDAEQKV